VFNPVFTSTPQAHWKLSQFITKLTEIILVFSSPVWFKAIEPRYFWNVFLLLKVIQFSI